MIQFCHNCLKSQTRKKRGKGIRRRVEASSSLPKNWQHFFAWWRQQKGVVCFFGKAYPTFGNQEADHYHKWLSCHLQSGNRYQSSSSLQSWRSWYKDDSPFMWCSPQRFSENLTAYSRYGWCSCLVGSSSIKIEYPGALGSIWNRKQFRKYEMAASIGPRKSQALPMFHAYHRVWHSFIICYKGK